MPPVKAEARAVCRFRLSRAELAALGRIMVQGRHRTQSDALRFAIHQADPDASPAAQEPAGAPNPAPAVPAPVKAPGEPCPRCGRVLPVGAHARPHHPTGKAEDLARNLPKCPGTGTGAAA